MSLKEILFYILFALVSGGFVTYIYFCIRFYFGYKYYKPTLSYTKKTVSVIIVSRNEADNLRKLLLILVNQNYPKNLYEVIVQMMT
jgi:cellulose synthase/poly-beta-1,6-N-acetylglucosamine synthase-like glycosyltransferase